MLHGGFMQGDAVMAAGSAGCGKTTLALQYSVNGVKLGEWQEGLSQLPRKD
ncbi:hypothetical protein E6H32_01460 [Candidatus Bathyarchaeota archaeon]|nr:MAG: hypothetical protein E6H32_01460 [Candidatus Bathyarchaeota archaeon]